MGYQFTTRQDGKAIAGLSVLLAPTTPSFPLVSQILDNFRKRSKLQLEHEEELTNPQKDRELAGLFTCEVCDATFHSKHILRIHSKAHKKISVTQKCDNYYKYYLNIRVF